MSIGHKEWYEKRDVIHDVVCEYFDTGSDDGLPVGERVMTMLFGPAPEKPAPSGEFRAYDSGGNGRDLRVDALVPAFSEAPRAVISLGHGHQVFMDDDTADHVADTLKGIARWMRERDSSALRQEQTP